MRLVFAGTPEFAERSLAALLAAGHDVALVLTQPDRAAGRGMRSTQSAVKRLALSRGLPLLQPESLKTGDTAARVIATGAEAMIVAAYGMILPAAMLQAARYGALNVHASLLPRWRGAAPIQRALLAGDQTTGISVMQMDAGLDTGPVLEARSIDIRPDEDAGTLHDRLAELGASMIVATLSDLAAGRARRAPQPAEGVIYARKIEKRETVLDWNKPATELERAIRAFRPSPGAGTVLNEAALKIWRARVLHEQGVPGTLLRAEGELVIACGRDALAVEQLQRAGGKRVQAADFLRGHSLVPGTRFGAAVQ